MDLKLFVDFYVRHVFWVFHSIFFSYSLVCSLSKILFIGDEKIPVNPAKSIRATIAYRLSCVLTRHGLYTLVRSQNNNPG